MEAGCSVDKISVNPVTSLGASPAQRWWQSCGDLIVCVTMSWKRTRSPNSAVSDSLAAKQLERGGTLAPFWPPVPFPAVQLTTARYEKSASVTQSCQTLLWPHGPYPARLLHPWDSPGKNTGVGCHALLQGIFLTQWSKPGLPHCRQILYHLSHEGGHIWFGTIKHPF